MTRERVMASNIGLMVIDMKGTGRTVIKMDMESYFLQAGKSIWANGGIIWHMEMGK